MKPLAYHIYFRNLLWNYQAKYPVSKESKKLASTVFASKILINIACMNVGINLLLLQERLSTRMNLLALKYIVASARN